MNQTPSDRPTRSHRATGRPSGDPSSALYGLRVALVDDDKLVLTVVGRFLKRRGCRVRPLQDPETAIDVISRDPPDALIVDMQMPGITGLQLVARLTRRLNGLPLAVMFLTSVEDEDALKTAFQLGATDYLIKPVTEAELATKLEKSVAAHRAKQPPAIPPALGGCEIEAELRRGEVASVYRVRGHRARSLKVLRPGQLGNASALLQLNREIDALAACDHPGVMALNRSGLEEGFLFYVTDTYPELPLGRDVRDEGGLDESGLIAMLRSVGGALEHLHERGLIVGDMTPESLGRLPNGRVVITDLGAARRETRWRRDDLPALPRSRYLAPELFVEGSQPTQRTDLYSLGICLLEAHAIRAAVRNRTSERVDVASIGKELSEPMQNLITQLLEPEPERRFANATAMLNALDPFAS